MKNRMRRRRRMYSKERKSSGKEIFLYIFHLIRHELSESEWISYFFFLHHLVLHRRQRFVIISHERVYHLFIIFSIHHHITLLRSTAGLHCSHCFVKCWKSLKLKNFSLLSLCCYKCSLWACIIIHKLWWNEGWNLFIMRYFIGNGKNEKKIE